MIKRLMKVCCFFLSLSVYVLIILPEGTYAIEKVRCSSQLSINGDEIALGSTIAEVSEDDVFQLKFTITYIGEPQTAIITFPKMEGVEIDTNYPIYIDGKETEQRSITTQIHNGTEISMNLKYIDNQQDIIPRIYLNIIDEGQHSFAFKYQALVSEIDSTHILVRSYGMNGAMLSYEQIKKGQSITLPDYKLIGYNIKGFNDRKDGSGNFYKGESIFKNTDLYAICEAKEYKVYYYVNDEIFKEDTVVFGEKIKSYTPPKLQGKEFLYWVGKVDDEQDIIYVYAVYQNLSSDTYYFDGSDVSEKELEEKIDDLQIDFEKIGGSNSSLNINEYMKSNINIKVDAAGNVTLDSSNSNILITNLKQNTGALIWFGSLLFFITITILKRLKMKKKK